MLGFFLSHFSTGSLTESGTHKVRLDGQQGPRSHLSPPPSIEITASRHCTGLILSTWGQSPYAYTTSPLPSEPTSQVHAYFTFDILSTSSATFVKSVEALLHTIHILLI